MIPFGNYLGMLITSGNTFLKCNSEEPVLPSCPRRCFLATKNLAFRQLEEILRHSGAGKEHPASPFLRMTCAKIG
jgi:hypothetical protein